MRFSIRFLLATVGLATALTSCTTTYITPLAVTELRRLDVTAEPSAQASLKTFTLPNDWQYGSWVLKRGATITFSADGTGVFAGTIYSHAVAGRYHDEVHLQSIQYGRDGNSLFIFPGTEIGLPLSLRAPYRDFPYESRFAFDKRYFAEIESVKWFARLRQSEEATGAPIERRAQNYPRSSATAITGPIEPIPAEAR